MKTIHNDVANEAPIHVLDRLTLRQLDIVELVGHNMESRGREQVNRLLQEGWHFLHIDAGYTLFIGHWISLEESYRARAASAERLRRGIRFRYCIHLAGALVSTQKLNVLRGQQMW